MKNLDGLGFLIQILCIHNELMSIPSTHNGDYEYSTARNHAKHGQIILDTLLLLYSKSLECWVLKLNACSSSYEVQTTAVAVESLDLYHHYHDAHPEIKRFAGKIWGLILQQWEIWGFWCWLKIFKLDLVIFACWIFLLFILFLVLLKSTFSPRSLCHFSISPQPCDQDQPTNSAQDFYLPLHVAPFFPAYWLPSVPTPYLRMTQTDLFGKLERLRALNIPIRPLEASLTLGPQTCLANIICSNFAWCFDIYSSGKKPRWKLLSESLFHPWCRPGEVGLVVFTVEIGLPLRSEMQI